MEDFTGNPGFLPGNSSIQETYQDIQGQFPRFRQKFQEAVPEFPRFFRTA